MKALTALEQARQLVAARDHALAQNTIDALWRWLDQPRTLLKGGEGTVGMTFCRVGNTVLKVLSQTQSGDLVYNVARNVVNCARDQVAIFIAPATEGDLLDALEVVRGGARLRVQEFLGVVRDEPMQPLEIRVVNANEIGPRTKVAAIKRNDDGKMTGLVMESIDEPN